jgi:hypothetical protein
LERVRSSSSVASENPAVKLIDFFDQDYARMSCGGLLLDTSRACQHSESLRTVGPVSSDLARKYIASWKLAGVLKHSFVAGAVGIGTRQGVQCDHLSKLKS